MHVSKHTPLAALLERVVGARLQQCLAVLLVSERQPAVSAWRNLGLIDIDKDSRMAAGTTTFTPSAHAPQSAQENLPPSQATTRSLVQRTGC